MAKFPPPQNRPMHRSAQNESKPHDRMIGMSRGQVSNLEGAMNPADAYHSRSFKATPERKKGFKFPSSFSGAAKPGGPAKPGVAYGARKPWAERS